MMSVGPLKNESFKSTVCTDFYLHKAQYSWDMGWKEDAFGHLQTALHLSLEPQMIHKIRGLMYLLEGLWHQAYLELSHLDHPGDAMSCILRAEALYQLGDDEDAKGEYTCFLNACQGQLDSVNDFELSLWVQWGEKSALYPRTC